MDVGSKRCLDGCCDTRGIFNFEEIKNPAYPKKHAEDGVVNVHIQLC